MDAIARRPLASIALCVALVKAIEFAIDSQALFFPDSGGFLMNALGVYFVPFRSFVYGYLIRIFAVPAHSLPMIVAMQVTMGGFTAWLLGAMLIRFFHVKPWIALAAALVFAIDPAQMIYEHMVMAETATLVALALYLVAALYYLERPALPWLALLSLLGILLVSFRISYVPFVILASALLPLAGWWRAPARSRRVLALGLLVSCGSTLIVHTGYRRLVGHRIHREPDYTYMNGYFLMSSVSPLLKPVDSNDARISAAVLEQSRSALPLLKDTRGGQMWDPDGLRLRMLKIFAGDDVKANNAASQLARAAIRRDPLGYADLAVYSYLSFWRLIPNLRAELQTENGTLYVQMTEREAGIVSKWFGVDISRQGEWNTFSRRYHIATKYWYIFLLVSPFLTLAAWIFGSVNRPGLAFLSVSAFLILISVCFGSQGTDYRYLHPYSFLGLASLAVLADFSNRTASSPARLP